MADAKIDRAMSQFMLIDALSSIYHSLHIIDLKKNTIVEYNAEGAISYIEIDNRDASGFLDKVVDSLIISEYKNAATDFVDLSTLSERMLDKKTISAEFISAHAGWLRARFISVDKDENGLVIRVIFAIEIIDEERRREEKLIKISLTDELTTLLNRRAYEEETAEYEGKNLPDDLVYISLDINGLKGVNDNLGHAAGDELIINSAKIIRAGLGTIGKVFRTGGDEFMAIVRADAKTLEGAFAAMDELIKNYKGSYDYELAISKGAASVSEFNGATLKELAHEADVRMYADKERYYRETGKDRRR